MWAGGWDCFTRLRVVDFFHVGKGGGNILLWFTNQILQTMENDILSCPYEIKHILSLAECRDSAYNYIYSGTY